MNHIKNQIYGSLGVIAVALILTFLILLKEGYWA